MRILMTSLLTLFLLLVMTPGCGGQIGGDLQAPAAPVAPAALADVVPACDGFELVVELAGLTHLVVERQPSASEFWAFFPDPTNHVMEGHGIHLPSHSTTIQFDPAQVDVGALPTRACYQPRPDCRQLVLDGMHLELDGLPAGPVSADWLPRQDRQSSLWWLLDADRLVEELQGEKVDQTPLRERPYSGNLLQARLRGSGGHLATRTLWTSDGVTPLSYELVRGAEPDDVLETTHVGRSLGWSGKVQGCAAVELTSLATGEAAGTLTVHGGGKPHVLLEIQSAPNAVAHDEDDVAHDEGDEDSHFVAHYSFYELPEGIAKEDLFVVRREDTKSTSDDAQCSPSTGNKDP